MNPNGKRAAFFVGTAVVGLGLVLVFFDFTRAASDVVGVAAPHEEVSATSEVPEQALPATAATAATAVAERPPRVRFVRATPPPKNSDSARPLPPPTRTAQTARAAAETDALAPAREALDGAFKEVAMEGVMGCMSVMVQEGHSFSGSLIFDVRGKSVEDGLVDFQVDSLELRAASADHPDLPDTVIECLDQSINSLVSKLPGDAMPLFRDGGEPSFSADLSMDLEGVAPSPETD